jgi:nickel/cobalt transporter (NicO) family protein
MRKLTVALAVLAAIAAVWVWGLGGSGQLAARAAALQHGVQNAMAGALRRLQTGDMAALLTLWGLCFAYGFVHAAGPGHGKMVIGGYGLARRVPLVRLSLLAVGSSLAQAATAVILVYAGLLVLGWDRDQMQGLADRGLAQFSALCIAGIGLWLLLRGARSVWQMRSPAPAMPAPDTHGGSLHGLGRPPGLHNHPDDGICDTCGHAHGPSIAQAAEVKSLRDAVMVIGAIAVRPCTGALFLLILTWRLGLDWAGIIGAFVMGLGTACVTLVVALASVSVRESALMGVASGPGIARTMALGEVLGGAVVLTLALHLFRQIG